MSSEFLFINYIMESILFLIIFILFDTAEIVFAFVNQRVIQLVKESKFSSNIIYYFKINTNIKLNKNIIVDGSLKNGYKQGIPISRRINN